MKKENDVLQYVSNSLNQISAYITKKYPEREWMYRAQRLYWEKVYQANEKGYPVVWHSLSVSPELLNAIGTVPVCLDGLASTLAALNMGANKYIDIAQKYVPDQICAVNKTGIGLALSRDIPKPNAVIYTSTPCDSARTAYPLIAEHLKVPHFCIDTPIEENERGYGYIANEIRGAVSFLEDVTRQKLNWEVLAKAISYSNQAYELISQIGELRKVVPCPLSSRLLVLNGIFLNMIGSPELVNFLRAEYNMGKEKVERKEGHLAEEKIRIAWIQNLIFFDLGILDWMEKEYGAIVPMDAFGFRESCLIEDTSDEEKVFKGLAKRLLRIPMIHGTSCPAECWMESVTEIVREYKCDAAIFAGHVGCKHTWAVGKLIKDMIFDKFGISTLVFDVDSLDPRYTGPEIIKYRIKNFLEIIQ